MAPHLQCHLCGARWTATGRYEDLDCPNGCDAHSADKALTDAEAVELAIALYAVGSKRRQHGGHDATKHEHAPD